MGLVSVTFDNLGEAAEIEGGTWRDDQPLGEHFSVVDILPRLLERLDAHGVRATFFVEGLNAEMNPAALERIRDGGHEVACHAWRHENWGSLDAQRERELLERCRDALAPAGFRPPGGQLTERTPALLRELGFTYASPAGERAGVLDRVAMLPFRWRLVDAYYYLPHFADLRERNGDPADPMPPSALRDAVIEAIDAHEDGHLTLLFHPFLFSMGDECLDVIDAVMEHVAAREQAGALRCVRMEEAAAHVSGVPELDSSSWM
jgi:peptidoglycan/xylan/chitin deacetylase (PgdA/CDA1 family)